MNQAVSFGLVFGGGVLLVSVFEGSTLSDLFKGKTSGKISTTGHTIGGTLAGGVGGVGQAIAGAINSVGSSVGAAGLKQAFHAAGLTLGRTDQGVDFAGSGPIPAVITGTVTRVDPRGSGNGWPGGAMVVVQGTGPDTGRITYLAENFDPLVKVGDHVQAGATALGTAIGSYPYIEYGWAADPQGTTLSAAHGTRDTHPNHSNTPEGLDFLKFIGFA